MTNTKTPPEKSSPDVKVWNTISNNKDSCIMMCPVGI